MRILFLSRWYPYPPDNGSKLRVFNLLQALCRSHRVTLISFFTRGDDISRKTFTGLEPEEIRACPFLEFNPLSHRALAAYLAGTPRYLVDTHSREMETLIGGSTQRRAYDLVIASQLAMARYQPCFRGIPAIFEEAELGMYWPIQARGVSNWTRMRRTLTWTKHRRFMARLLQDYTCCTVASEIERRLLATVAPRFSNIHLIPNCIDVAGYPETTDGREAGSLIFPGSLSYGPNYDAMKWFLSEIYPLIQRQRPDVQLKITGDSGHRALPTASNVCLTGKIPDLPALLASSAISLAPIRFGGGTRLKILESFALRTPVVTTTKGMEGLEAQHGEHLLVADTPRAFAEAVLRLIREPMFARKLAENAFTLVQARYDSRVVLPEFLKLAEQAASRQ